MKFVSKISLFVIPLVVICYFKVDYTQFTNMDSILSASISFSSAAMGFFIAGVAILQTSNLSRLYSSLTKLGTDKKITSWLMTATGYMFVLSAFSLIGFFLIPPIVGWEIMFFNVWLALICAALLSTFWVIIIFCIIFTKE